MTDENKQILQDYIDSHPDTIDNLDIKKIDEDFHNLVSKYKVWYLFSDFIQLLVDEIGLQNLLSSAKSFTKSPFEGVKIHDSAIDVENISYNMFSEAQFMNDFKIKCSNQISSYAFVDSNMIGHDLIIQECPIIKSNAFYGINNIHSIILPANLKRLELQKFPVENIICKGITMSQFIQLIKESSWWSYSSSYINTRSDGKRLLNCDVMCKDGTISRFQEFDKDYNLV